jgi:hypothetical protein
MKGIIGYFRALLSPQFAPTGIKVAVVVGTILLTIKLGVEKVVTDLPSHSEPCVRFSPHTAPSLTVPLLRIQLDFFWLTLYYPV